MIVGYLLLVSATILANVCFAVADFRRSEFVRETSAAVGVPESWYPLLGALKAAGATGLLLGLLGPLVGLPGLTALGMAAAAGLVAFYTAALAAHLRARAFAGVGYTVAMWCSAAGCLALMLVLAHTGTSIGPR